MLQREENNLESQAAKLSFRSEGKIKPFSDKQSYLRESSLSTVQRADPPAEIGKYMVELNRPLHQSIGSIGIDKTAYPMMRETHSVQSHMK